MTAAPSFAIAEIESAVTEFRASIGRLTQARWATWQLAMQRFVDVCAENPVLRAILQPTDGARPDTSAWLLAVERESGVIPGTANLPMPRNRQERIALLYALLEDAAELRLNPYALLVTLTGFEGNFDRRVSEFAELIVAPFAEDVERELRRMLNEGREREPVVPAFPLAGATIQTLIWSNGPMQGNTIATDGGTIQHGHDDAEPLLAALRAWQRDLADVAAEQRADVREALDVLATALERRDAQLAELTVAAQRLAAAGPSVRQRLTSLLSAISTNTIGGAFGTALAPHAVHVLTALQMALALPPTTVAP